MARPHRKRGAGGSRLPFDRVPSKADALSFVIRRLRECGDHSLVGAGIAVVCIAALHETTPQRVIDDVVDGYRHDRGL